MDRLTTILLRLRSLLAPRSLENELNDELRFHMHMQTETYLRSGMSPEEARRRALLDFGGMDRIAEECRDVRTGPRLHLLARAMRLGARRLLREPGFTLPSLATLAIGFGALLAIFTLADAVLFRPLPYLDPDRIVVLRHALPGLNVADAGQAPGSFVHYRDGAEAFENMGAYFDRDLNITDGDAPERVQTALVTYQVLEVLGVRPLLGRSFTKEDSNASTVMLGYDMWQRRYGGDRSIIGRTIEVNAVSREVVGVLPPNTAFPSASTQLLFAMSLDSDPSDLYFSLNDLYINAIARLRPGVTLEGAEADLARLTATLGEESVYVTSEAIAAAQLTPRVYRLKESLVGDVRPALILLLCMAAFVLLIALANVANLALVRAEHQRREVAVERALGAGRGILALRFAAEYSLLVLTGALIGLAGATLAVHFRFGFEAWQIPRLHEAIIGGRVLALAVTSTALTASLLATIGMLRSGRADVQAALKSTLQRVTGTRESRLLLQALTAMQVALACALLVGSALMVQSVARLGGVPLGFRPDNVLVFDYELPSRQYVGYTAPAQFVDALSDELRRIPGVEAAGMVTMLPLTPLPTWYDLPVAAGGSAGEPAVHPVARGRVVSTDYFNAMGIPILRGRTFQPGDLHDAGSAVILSESMARRLFGASDAVGRAIRLPEQETRIPARDVAALTVVGVAADVRDASIGAPPAPLLYFPSLGTAQLTDGRAPIPFYPSGGSFAVRSTLPRETLVPAIRAAVRHLDPRLPIANVRTLHEVVAASSARTRLTTWLVAAGAASAMLLGLVGIYGVVTYTVSRRAPELALRMALGASPAHLRYMVLGQGGLIALLGIAAGVPLAFALTRLLSGLLFEVSPSDTRTFVIVPLAMLFVAVAASGAPARRAARTSPARALSAD